MSEGYAQAAAAKHSSREIHVYGIVIGIVGTRRVSRVRVKLGELRTVVYSILLQRWHTLRRVGTYLAEC